MSDVACAICTSPGVEVVGTLHPEFLCTRCNKVVTDWFDWRTTILRERDGVSYISINWAFDIIKAHSNGLKLVTIDANGQHIQVDGPLEFFSYRPGPC